jgi:dTDP-4-amino-4,6-dideoxygalactose transaminase
MEKTACFDFNDFGSSYHQEHSLRIKRTIPPAASPLSFTEILHGLCGMRNKKAAKKLENEIREYYNAKYVFTVSSGKAALFLILTGMKMASKRRKVIIPAYTCYSVPSAIVKAGLDAIPCDMKPDTLDYDFEKLQLALDSETLCVISTHLFGIPSDVERIRRICSGRGIYVIEDAAQAMGVTEGDKKIGTYGDAAFFSLGRGKNITCGSGGIIVTSSDAISSAISKAFEEVKREPATEIMKTLIEIFLMTIFLNPSLYWIPDNLPFLKIGETIFDTNFPVYRLSDFKAGLLDRCFSKLERLNRARASVSELYMDAMKPGRVIPIYHAGRPYLRFPIYQDDAGCKDRTYDRFRNHGVSRMYPDSVNRIKELKIHSMGGEYPGAERIAKTLLTLPTHILLKDKDINALRELVKGR